MVCAPSRRGGRQAACRKGVANQSGGLKRDVAEGGIRRSRLSGRRARGRLTMAPQSRCYSGMGPRRMPGARVVPSRRFEPLHVFSNGKLTASFGSAPRSGRGGRRFKSCHSDQHLAKIESVSATESATAWWDEWRTSPRCPSLHGMAQSPCAVTKLEKARHQEVGRKL